MLSCYMLQGDYEMIQRRQRGVEDAEPSAGSFKQIKRGAEKSQFVDGRDEPRASHRAAKRMKKSSELKHDEADDEDGVLLVREEGIEACRFSSSDSRSQLEPLSSSPSEESAYDRSALISHIFEL